MYEEDKTHDDWMKEADDYADHISDAHGNEPMCFMVGVLMLLIAAVIVVAIIGMFI